MNPCGKKFRVIIIEYKASVIFAAYEELFWFFVNFRLHLESCYLVLNIQARKCMNSAMILV
jgi:hypothetical protein